VPFTFQVCKGARKPSQILHEALWLAYQSTSAAGKLSAISANARKKESFQMHSMQKALHFSRRPSPPSQKMLRPPSLKVVVPQTLKAFFQSKISISTVFYKSDSESFR